MHVHMIGFRKFWCPAFSNTTQSLKHFQFLKMGKIPDVTDRWCSNTLFYVVVLFVSTVFGVIIYFHIQYHSYYTNLIRQEEQEQCSPSSEESQLPGKPPPLPLDVNFVEQNLDFLKQEDTRLIQYTRMRYLTPPSKLPYNLNPGSAGNSPDIYTAWVAQFFQNKTHGIFIEVGAQNGVRDSRSLYLEKSLGWTGLLIECNPRLIPSLRSTRRKAWVAGVCLSLTDKPETTKIGTSADWAEKSWMVGPKADDPPHVISMKHDNRIFAEVVGVPLYTLLAAIGWTDVDYFSLDIHGQKLNVLKHFRFDKVRVKVFILQLDLFHIQELRDMDALFTKNGYVFVHQLEYDYVYLHKETFTT